MSQQPARVLAARGRMSPLPQPEHGPARPGDLRSNLVDATAARGLVGWQPTVPLAEHLAKTAAWFAER